MLSHPTLDQLGALGLHGIAKGFKDLAANPEAAPSTILNDSACCSTTRSRSGDRNASKPDHGSPVCVSRQGWKMSIIAPPAVSIARFSSSSPAATGSGTSAT